MNKWEDDFKGLLTPPKAVDPIEIKFENHIIADNLLRENVVTYMMIVSMLMFQYTSVI